MTIGMIKRIGYYRLQIVTKFIDNRDNIHNRSYTVFYAAKAELFTKKISPSEVALSSIYFPVLMIM